MTQPAARPSRLRPERPWQEHAGPYRDLFADPAVAAALWPRALGAPRTEREAAEMLAQDIAHWHERSFGPWVFFESATGVFVGRGGLRTVDLAGSECVEVLYAVRSDAWGRGYATEIARLAVAHARRLGLAEVVGFTATTNRASRRVLEKAGRASMRSSSVRACPTGLDVFARASSLMWRCSSRASRPAWWTPRLPCLDAPRRCRCRQSTRCSGLR